MFTTTQEIPITPELLARIFPPKRRELAPPPSIHELAMDAICRAELQLGMTETRSELRAISAVEDA
jgi:hypothetical protein